MVSSVKFRPSFEVGQDDGDAGGFEGAVGFDLKRRMEGKRGFFEEIVGGISFVPGGRVAVNFAAGNAGVEDEDVDSLAVHPANGVRWEINVL